MGFQPDRIEALACQAGHGFARVNLVLYGSMGNMHLENFTLFLMGLYCAGMLGVLQPQFDG